MPEESRATCVKTEIWTEREGEKRVEEDVYITERERGWKNER